MTDHMDRSDDRKQDGDSRGSKLVENKKTLDTFFPSRWLVVLMVGIVLVFNIIVGMKVFSLQKEKAVIEILKARYESYAKIIRDVEDKEETLRILTQEIVPLEKRAENAQKEVAVSNERVEKNKNELNKIKASKAEVIEELGAANTTIAELSNEKKTLRKEKQKLERLVAELNINGKRTEQKITEKKLELRVTKENILAAGERLKDQQKYIKDVVAANSNFDDIRKQLLKFIKQMDETQAIAGERIKDLQVIIAGVAEEKDQLSSQTVNLTNEAKTIAQSNASLKEEISGFKEQNKEYKSEIENVTSISGQMKNIAGTIKGTATNIGIDEKIVNKNAKAIKESLGKMETANEKLVQASKQFTVVVTDVTKQTVNLTNEAKTIAQSNASLKEEISGFKEQNKEYKSEIENVTSISGQMKNIAENIKGTATNIGIDEGIVSENAKAIKENLGQMATVNRELVQTSEQFTAVVIDVTSQRGNIDTFIQEIADFPDMEVQVIAFKKVLNDIDEVTRKLSERVSAIQSNFDGKLDGMNLSFGSLEEDFTDLSLKIDGVEQALEEIANRAQKVLKKSQDKPLSSE